MSLFGSKSSSVQWLWRITLSRLSRVAKSSGERNISRKPGTFSCPARLWTANSSAGGGSNSGDTASDRTAECWLRTPARMAALMAKMLRYVDLLMQYAHDGDGFGDCW